MCLATCPAGMKILGGKKLKLKCKCPRQVTIINLEICDTFLLNLYCDKLFVYWLNLFIRRMEADIAAGSVNGHLCCLSKYLRWLVLERQLAELLEQPVPPELQVIVDGLVKN